MPVARACLLLLLATLLAAVATPSGALELRIADAGLTPDQADATHRLFDMTAARLPPAWAGAIASPVQVEWRSDLPPQVHGRALHGRILLRRTLLDDWMADGGGASIERPAARAALAALVHELAHLYDRGPRGGLSRDPRLLDLAGWQVAPLRAGGRIRRNPFRDRSPDPYELASPREFVAVNLEHFLLDPDYACRRPALHRHFAARLGERPMPACAEEQPFVQADASAASPLLTLDPARILAVDYLLAEPDRHVMSRWGHGMLRLVVCAPGRPRGPDCRLDLAHHVVLSFRAFVDDVGISGWRGLTGAYPSRLFVLPLSQVVDEYTKVELRGLRSVPLRLSPDEISGLLERAAKLHWSYDGRYYFVTGNCAVETWRLLHDGVPRLAGAPLAGITPTGLLRRLQRAGIADATVLDDPERALRLGYRFESLGAHYQAMLDAARETLPLPQSRVRDWLDLPPQARAQWIGQADLRAAAALLLLERAALRRDEERARAALARTLARSRSAAGDDSDPMDAAHGLLRIQAMLTRPATLLPPGGYGIPQRGELQALAAAAEQHAALWRDRGTAWRALVRDRLPPARRASLEASEANIARLGERLRLLHRDGGGLEIPPQAAGARAIPAYARAKNIR